MKIKTVNRRTFIKTMGGLVIAAPFVAKMAPLHAAGLPDTIKFKATVAKNTKKAGYKVLETSSPGYVSVTRDGVVINEYQFQAGGQVEFDIPTDGSSNLVWNILDKYGLITRVFGAEFNNGVLSLTNKLREDAPIPYYWSPEENCYQIEYYHDNIFICGPSDPDSYLMSLSWVELNRISAKEVKPASPDLDPSDCSSCSEAECDPMHPGYSSCKDCAICQGEEDDDEGEGDDNYGVPDDSTTTDGSMEEQRCYGSYCGSDGMVINGADMKPQQTPRLNPPNIAFSALMPEGVDIYQKQDMSPQIETLEFGMMLKVIDPSGAVIGEQFLPFGEERAIANGMNFTITWQDRAPFPAMRVYPSWTEELLEGLASDVYKFIFWTKTTDGRESNKRIIYWTPDAPSN